MEVSNCISTFHFPCLHKYSFPYYTCMKGVIHQSERNEAKTHSAFCFLKLYIEESHNIFTIFSKMFIFFNITITVVLKPL